MTNNWAASGGAAFIRLVSRRITFSVSAVVGFLVEQARAIAKDAYIFTYPAHRHRANRHHSFDIVVQRMEPTGIEPATFWLQTAFCQTASNRNPRLSIPRRSSLARVEANWTRCG